MISFIATVAIQTHDSRRYRFWIPLGILWLLLLPVLLLLLPLFCIACIAIRVHPLRALRNSADILSSLKGMDLEVERPQRTIEMRLL